MKALITLMVYLFLAVVQCVPAAHAQQVYYQDVFRGGVTGGGYNPGNSDLPGEIELYIEPGSIIRRAFLFVGIYNAADYTREVTVNGNPILLDSSSGLLYLPFTAWFISLPSPILLQSLIIDVSESVSI